MMDRRVFLAGLAVTAALVAGCQSETAASQPPSGICDRDAAEKLIGRNRLSDAEAKHLTGATVVRQIKPGDPVTMDYRQERITIETDPETGKIVRAFCG
jgi:hypothetical protein